MCRNVQFRCTVLVTASADRRYFFHTANVSFMSVQLSFADQISFEPGSIHFAVNYAGRPASKCCV